MNLSKIVRYRALLFAAFLLPVSVFSQFGQNKVQYKEFDWRYMQSKHFDVYFSQGGESIARYTADAAESSLVSLEGNIGYSIKNRVPIIVFNSHNEFQQNNAVDEYLPEGVGGVTELFKNRILVPFEGDYEKFRHVIHHELLHAYMNDMYYGGSLQNIISQNIKLQFPTWFSEGMAEYQSLSGNDKENDMFMRDAVVYDYLPDIDYIYGYLSYRGGQSFFAWLAEEYGAEKIGDLMQQIKALGDVYEGFEDVYKVPIEVLSEKWKKALKQNYWPDITLRQELNDFAKPITNSRRGDGFYNTAPAISPNGKYIVYISNRDDYFGVYLAEVKTGRMIKKLIEGTTTADFEELHLLTPGLCWSPDGKKIAITAKSGAKDAVYIFDVEEEEEKLLPIRFDGIFSVGWNPNNNSLVLRCDNAKQSDIWVYDLKTRKLTQITNDLFSDLDPTWSSRGDKIFFTSDRGNFTDLKNIPYDLRMIDFVNAEKDLYIYDMNTKELLRFGSKNATESNVVMSPDSKQVLYISDKNGISNIWHRDLETRKERPITNSLNPIHLLSLSADGKRLAFTALNKGGYDIFYIENPFEIDLNMTELPPTNFVKSKYPDANKPDSLLTVASDTTYIVGDSVVAALTDSAKISGDTSVYGNDIQIKLNDDRTEVDTMLLVDKELKMKSIDRNPEFNVNNNTNSDGSLKIHNYKIKFSPDIIYSNASYSSFYGVQGIAQMSFSDILGDHRIFIATSLVLDLKNSDYAFAYYYLPKRIDYGIEAFHTARFLLIGNSYTTSQLHRFRQYGVNLNFSFPITKFNRFEAALTFARLTKENMDNPQVPMEQLNFAMPVLSYVHDNTIYGYSAPIKGTRYNLSMLGTPNIGQDGISFISGIADFRTYYELADDYNFVLRFNAGASLGPDPQRFYIGGTENWINYDVANDQVPVEDIQDFAFSTPILPLRGFDYNERSGSKFALMNAEFRFPLFRYLMLGALPIAFQNIQGVAFLDVGTVWTDNKKLQLFYDNNGMAAKDLLIGMGVGTRIFFLYFPFKFDVAWSYNVKGFSQPKYYLSIGTDF